MVTLISLIVPSAVVWTIHLVRGGVLSADLRALAVLIAVAIALPVVRGLKYTGIARIGSACSSSLHYTHPFFSVAMAIAFLGEPARHDIMLGTLLTVKGIFVTCWEWRGTEPMPSTWAYCFH